MAVEIDVSVGRDAVVEHLFFQGETNISVPENVAELDSAIATDVVSDVQMDLVSISEGPVEIIIEGLVNVGTAFESGIPTGAIFTWRRSWCRSFEFRSGEERSGGQSAQGR